MSAIAPIVSKHDTALIEEEHYPERHCLRLVSGSAREYERRRQVIEKDLAPVGIRVAIALGTVGLVLLTFGVFYGLPMSVNLLRPTQVAPYAIYISLPLLGVAGIILAVNARRESLRESRLKALNASLGTQALPLASAVLLDTHARKAVLAGVLDGVTPDVRDRLLRLVGQGKKGVAEEAVSILLAEAKREQRCQQEREAREVLESRGSSARRVLGRRR